MSGRTRVRGRTSAEGGAGHPCGRRRGKDAGMDLSYTQNLEDYHLSLAFAGQPTGTYIDIGGGHPIADNVSVWFYERGWRGIVVEAQPDRAALYDRLLARAHTVCGVVGRTSGEIDFHMVERLHGFSTAVEHIARKAEA